MAEELTYVVLAVHSRGQYNTVPYLNKCMETLKQNTTNYRMIFVDDYCDEEGSNAIIRHAEAFPESYIIKTFKQRWFTRAYNLGLRLVRSSWAVLLNVDTELGINWLEELYSVRDEASQLGRVGLVGSEFSAEEGRRWQNITSPSTPGNPGYVTAHCWLVSMQAMYEISAARGMPGFYLDETKQENIHIRSDNEGSYAMQRLGWLTIRSFKSAVGHVGGRSWHYDLGRICGIRLQDVND